MDDRISLYLHTDAQTLGKAIEVHRTYLGGETLVTEWATGPLGAVAHGADVKVEGQPLRIELKKAAR